MNEVNMAKTMKEEDAEICDNCGNVYRLDLLKSGEAWNDFYFRYCPFCGLMMDELTGTTSF